ncbi:hypothetical protein R3Q06_32990 [Rhodococcus erythropolis]|uniref:hypothetical protein n=1 Tax=Rhodococcus erythropolis TaxID=1833 RepID=UPI0029495661|nr:hypothetical protein [Rhodococcus erythropolis]MDV6278275.1 hypothetical protein [Rhodococcus erythropolis]
MAARISGKGNRKVQWSIHAAQTDKAARVSHAGKIAPPPAIITAPNHNPAVATAGTIGRLVGVTGICTSAHKLAIIGRTATLTAAPARAANDATDHRSACS